MGRFHYPGKQHQIAGRAPLPPPSSPHRHARFSCLSVSHVGLSVPRAVAQHWEPASQVPSPPVGVTAGEGARPGAQKILSHSWWTGNGVGKKKIQPNRKPPTHILAMERADTSNCRPPERSGSKTIVHVSASSYHFCILDESTVAISSMGKSYG